MRKIFLLLAAFGFVVPASGVSAASLQVAPVTIDLASPKQTAVIHLQNSKDRPVAVQVRVFKWTQVKGRDQLTPTNEVVASPPFAQLKKGSSYTIRVARTGRPVKSGEDSYRLLIDQLPEVNVRRPGDAVDLIIRYSIPVFFGDRSAAADVKWDVSRKGKQVIVTATNRGDRHAKIADLTLSAPGGRLSLGKGLNGYVLPGQTRQWAVSERGARMKRGTRVTITAGGDDYAVKETAIVGAR
jgi:fimbrial chaperone protein